MSDQQMIQQFLELIDQTGLSEDRKTYWVDKIASPDFSEADEKAFEAEIQAHMNGLEEDIRFLEFEKKSLIDEKKDILAEALPSLQQMAKEAPALMDAEFSQFKQSVLGDEKMAMDQIEGIRSEKDSDAIVALRKRLKKG